MCDDNGATKCAWKTPAEKATINSDVSIENLGSSKCQQEQQSYPLGDQQCTWSPDAPNIEPLATVFVYNPETMTQEPRQAIVHCGVFYTNPRAKYTTMIMGLVGRRG